MVNNERTFRLYIESSSAHVRTKIKIKIKIEIRTSYLLTKLIRYACIVTQ